MENKVSTSQKYDSELNLLDFGILFKALEDIHSYMQVKGVLCCLHEKENAYFSEQQWTLYIAMYNLGSSAWTLKDFFPSSK